MIITRRSPFSHETHSMEIDVTKEQLDEWYGGKLIQKVMPHLTAEEREFLMTGITPEDWEKIFAEK